MRQSTLIKSLVESSVALDVADLSGSTPIEYAVDLCRLEVIKYFISQGVSAQEMLNRAEDPENGYNINRDRVIQYLTDVVGESH